MGSLPKPYYQDEACAIYHGDCREVLPRLDLTAATMVTDPPFNVGKDYGACSDSLPAHEYRELVAAVVACGSGREGWVAPKVRLPLFFELMPDARLVIVKRGAHGPRRWGWYDQFDTLLVRGKPRYPFRNLWEDIRLKGEGYFFREHDYGHPGYTPYPLLARLVDLLSEPGGLVAEPFCGSGTTLLAAKNLGRKAIGIEIEERYCEIAAKRLAQEVLPLEA